MEFIKKRIEVEEADITSTYRIGKSFRGWRFQREKDRIFFVGLRGSGKSTLGREVARELGMNFLDMDEEIERKTGVPIYELVQQKGWEGFREIEKKVLKDSLLLSATVVATGGGVVVDEENRALLTRERFVFYLMADINTLVQRLREHGEMDKRPPLTSYPLEEEMVHLLREREPYYLEVSNFILRADRTLEELRERVKTFLGV